MHRIAVARALPSIKAAIMSQPRFDASLIGKVSRVHTFSAGCIDRVHNSRSNPTFVQAQLQRADALFVPFSRLRPLLRTSSTAPATGPSNQIGWCTLAELQSALQVTIAPVRSGEQIVGHTPSTTGPDTEAEWVMLGLTPAQQPLFVVDVSNCVRGTLSLSVAGGH